jgi:hypothetical protein
MSRRRNLGPRGKTGRLLLRHSVDHALMSPTEIRRLVDASRAGLRSAEFSSEVGRLLLTGAITSHEFAIAQRWAALSADYSRACCGPRPPARPRSTPPTAPASIPSPRPASARPGATAAPSPNTPPGARSCARARRRPSVWSLPWWLEITPRSASPSLGRCMWVWHH